MDQSKTASPDPKDSSNVQSRGSESAKATALPNTVSTLLSTASTHAIVNDTAPNQSKHNSTAQPLTNSTAPSDDQSPPGKLLVGVGTLNLRTDAAFLPSRVPVRDPTTRPQPSRPLFRPFANHQGAASTPADGPVWPTFGVLDDLVFPFAQNLTPTCLNRYQVRGGKTIPPDQMFYSIRAQHYEDHATAPATDDLTPLVRTPAAAVSRLRAESEASGLFAGRKIVSQLYYLDGTVKSLPTVEGLLQGGRDVVHAVVFQTWVGDEGGSTLEDFMDGE